MHTVSDQGRIKGRLPESEQANDVGPENHQRGEASAADAVPPVMVQKSPSIALSGLIDTQLTHTQLTHTQLTHTQLTDTQLTDTQLTDTEAAGAVKATSSNGSVPGTIVQPALENSLSGSEPKVVIRGAAPSDVPSNALSNASSNTSSDASSDANTEPSTLSTSEVDTLILRATQGDAAAQTSLARRYYKGDGVEEDREEAAYWYTKAAEQGYADAQNKLGTCYFNGQGVDWDRKQAVYWYEKAAQQGHADAQNNLGNCYMIGLGVDEVNAKLAAYWFEEAAEQGHTFAQSSLGRCYHKGVGVEQNFDRAAYWKIRSALEKKAHRNEIILNVVGAEEVLKLIPSVLNKYPEFYRPKQVDLRVMTFCQTTAAVVEQLIRFDTSIEALIVRIEYDWDDDWDDDNAYPLIERMVTSLREENTWLTKLIFNLPIDDVLKAQLDQLCEQNKVIGEIRRYVLEHPTKTSDQLPLEVLSQVVDKLIVHRIRRGDGKAATQAAVDEFLMGAQYQVLESSRTRPDTI